ncbi:hypothetical protein FOZ60_017195 [Perkinsus olseni]|uniref:Uncharacterized protein n=1 Tax=Perkinsus olseni TaxID=32597 RepID=A0A7J6P425_PEROL|nr:hypothetical protein FOZ60_017195 [Perkinsus olseni]
MMHSFLMGHRSLITRYKLIAWALIVPTLAGPVADLPHRDTPLNEALPDGLPGPLEALGTSSSCAVVGSRDVAVGGVSFLERVCSRIVVATPNITEMERACFAEIDNDESLLPHEPLGPPRTLMPPDVRYFPVDSHGDIWSTFALGSNIRAIVLDHTQRVGDLREDVRNALRIEALRLIIFLRNSDEVLESLKDFQDKDYTHCQQEKVTSTGEAGVLCKVLRQWHEQPLSTLGTLRDFLGAEAAREWLLFWVKSFRYPPWQALRSHPLE